MNKRILRKHCVILLTDLTPDGCVVSSMLKAPDKFVFFSPWIFKLQVCQWNNFQLAIASKQLVRSRDVGRWKLSGSELMWHTIETDKHCLCWMRLFISFCERRCSISRRFSRLATKPLTLHESYEMLHRGYTYSTYLAMCSLQSIVIKRELAL